MVIIAGTAQREGGEARKLGGGGGAPGVPLVKARSAEKAGVKSGRAGRADPLGRWAGHCMCGTAGTPVTSGQVPQDIREYSTGGLRLNCRFPSRVRQKELWSARRPSLAGGSLEETPTPVMKSVSPEENCTQAAGTAGSLSLTPQI